MANKGHEPITGSERRKFGLRSLEAFAEIMRTGSATAAAKALGLSQPAVSRLISQFEQDIGFELFYRDKGRLVPTKDGTLLADEVELALAGVERVHGLVRDINTHSAGEIRLIAPPSFAEAIVPTLIAEFLALYPAVRISVDSRSIPTTKTMIATRVADCAFMRLPIDRDDLHAEVVVASKTVCVLRKDHPLAEAPSLSPELIGDMAVIALGTGNVYGRQIEEIFRSRGRRQKIAVETHTTSSACALAGKGVGIAIVNQLLAQGYVQEHMMMLPFEPLIVHDYAFVTSAQSPPSRLIAEFGRVTKEFLARDDRQIGQRPEV